MSEDKISIEINGMSEYDVEKIMRDILVRRVFETDWGRRKKMAIKDILVEASLVVEDQKKQMKGLDERRNNLARHIGRCEEIISACRKLGREVDLTKKKIQFNIK